MPIHLPDWYVRRSCTSKSNNSNIDKPTRIGASTCDREIESVSSCIYTCIWLDSLHKIWSFVRTILLTCVHEHTNRRHTTPSKRKAGRQQQQQFFLSHCRCVCRQGQQGRVGVAQERGEACESGREREREKRKATFKKKQIYLRMCIL